MALLCVIPGSLWDIAFSIQAKASIYSKLENSLHSQNSKGLLMAGNRPLYLSLPSLGNLGIGVALFLFFALHIWLACTVAPAEDELYYWAWSRHLLPSYFDHPPMVAYLIRLSTSLFGNSILAIRLPAIGISLVVLLSLVLLTPRSGLAWLLFFCPIVFAGGILITPDLPLVLFWILYAVWFSSINRSLDTWNQDPVTRVYRSSPVPWSHWILGGTLLGLGGLSKYTMALAVPCTLVALATRTRFRAWGLGFLLHLAVAAILVLPVFVFNWKHGFAPLAFQWYHSMSGSGFSLSREFYFIGTQVLLFGALPFLMFPWVLIRGRELCSDPRSAAYFWFFVIPFTFFLYKAARTELEANWAVAAYLTFWPLADRLLSWSSFKLAGRILMVLSFALPWTLTGLALVHLISPWSKLIPERDRLAVLQGQLEMSREVAEEIRNRHLTATLHLPNYQWTSYFRYLGIPSEQGIPFGRPSQFTLMHPRASCSSDEILVLEGSDTHASTLACFPHREMFRSFPVQARGQEVKRFYLSRYYR